MHSECCTLGSAWGNSSLGTLEFPILAFLSHTLKDMKRILIALLFTCGMAYSATTTVTDLTTTQSFTDASVTYTAPVSGSTMGSFSGSGTWALGGGNRAHAALTFTLNLTKLQSLSTQTTIVTVDTGADVGLIWGQFNNTWGLMGNWKGAGWANSGGAFVSYSTLFESAWSVADNSTDAFITLTMTVANTSGDAGGEQLYNAGSNSSYFSNAKGLGSEQNTSIDAILFNTDVIENAAVTSGWVPPSTASTLGTTLQNTFTTSHGGQTTRVPEPASSTLFLLALAGMAIRRRRK